MHINGVPRIRVRDKIGSARTSDRPFTKLLTWAAVACLLAVFAFGCSGESSGTEAESDTSRDQRPISIRSDRSCRMDAPPPVPTS